MTGLLLLAATVLSVPALAARRPTYGFDLTRCRFRTVITVFLLLAVATAAPAKREFVAQAKDFKCLTDGAQAPGKLFYIFNKHRRLRTKAVRMTETGKLGKGYPRGTILQVFPFEAMVKRGGDYNPAGDGWEFFKLHIAPDGQTAIVARGEAEVTNLAGSCQGCHMRLAAQHDAVCEFVIGAAGLGLTDAQVRALQAGDARCKH